MKKILALAFSLMLFGSLNASYVKAQTQAPDFPACTDQSGDGDHAHYDQGWHQILGGGIREGSDDVYTLDENNYLQCFCDADDHGIQTNWWYISDMGQDEINNFLNLKWMYVDNGSDWNLHNGPYLGKNSKYSCGSEPTPTPTTTPTPTPTDQPTPTPTSTEPTPTPTPHEDPKDCHADASCAGPKDPPVCTDPLPETPVLLSVSRSGDDSVELVWTEVKDSQYYLISYGLDSHNYIYGVPNVGNTQSYKIGGLDLNKKYYFQVKSHRGCVSSEGSNELSYPHEIGGGQVLGLAYTGVDYNLLKLIGSALGGTTMIGYGIKKLLNAA